MLKRLLSKEEWEKLSSEHQSLYVEKDGKYTLDAETSGELKDAQKKITEFRDNNIKVQKEIEDLKNKYKDMDPKKYAEAIKVLQKLEDQKLFDEGKIDELVGSKTQRMRDDYETQVKGLKEISDKQQREIDALKDQFHSAVIDNEIQLQVSRQKPREGTMEDIVARGRRTFSMDEEGKTVARNPDTEEQMFSKDAVTPLTIKEWAEELPNKAPHFFGPSTGTGALGGGGKERRFGISKEDLAKLPPTERLKLIHREDKTKK